MLNKKLDRREFLKLAVTATTAGLLAGCDRVIPGTLVPGPLASMVALTNGTVIDGTGRDPIPNATVLFDKGRIVEVSQNKAADVRNYDVKGATILPGFINAHVHGGYDEDTLKAWAQGGVTTVRDMAKAGDPTELFATRDDLNQESHCARLVAAGPFVTVPDGYPIEPWGMGAITVTGAEDARDKVTQLLDSGADIVKIALESGTYTFGQNLAMLSPDEAAAIVETAHARGIKVTVHITDEVDVAPALDAGVDDLAHMVVRELSDEQIKRVVDAGVTWVPTLELWTYVSEDSRVPFSEVSINNLRRFVEAGGTVAMGTDYAGYDADFDLGMPMTELELMQQAGMSPMQIIVASTQNAAEVCGLANELGTLENGKVADILVVGGNPLEDIGVLAQPALVVHNGLVIRNKL